MTRAIGWRTTICLTTKTMLSEADLIVPDWPAPDNVKALQTTRSGGISVAPYDGLNLGAHVGDAPLNVAYNRQLLADFVPTEPLWLDQVHGTTVIDAGKAGCQPEADAAFARVPHTVCTVMTADCLPVLLCNRAGTVVAAVHAGWRGLLHGVLEAAMEAMAAPPDSLLAWLGPAIGPASFEVGDEVRAAFVARDPEAAAAFTLQSDGKWLADIYALARLRLQQYGVTAIHGGQYCTYRDATRFYSYRRDGVSGRMATLIWLA